VELTLRTLCGGSLKEKLLFEGVTTCVSISRALQLVRKQMLTPNEFENWCRHQNLSNEAKEIVEIIRTSEPSRRVGGGNSSVHGRYPSRKMGVTIQFESHKVELPFIYEFEHSREVLEYYDQPPSIKLSYKSKNGQNIGVFTTPDFFVIERNSAGWVECKTEDKLRQLALKSPNRFIQCSDMWHTPPGEEYASKFGFFFRIASDNQINWILQRNLIFLDDYYRNLNNFVNYEAAKIIKTLVLAQPGITLAQLLHHHAVAVNTDDVYSLIANEDIYVDLTVAPLVEQERCLVFPDLLKAEAYSNLALKPVKESNIIKKLTFDLKRGQTLIYDGIPVTIELIGSTCYLLRTENGEPIEMLRTTLEQLVKLGKITNNNFQSFDLISTQVQSILLKASEKDLLDANYRYQVLEPWIKGGRVVNDTVSERTIRYWKHKFRQSEQKYGYGYIGLIALEDAKGNRCRKLPSHTLELMDSFISEHYETYKQKKKAEVYGAFVVALSEQGVKNEEIPSYKTFIREIKRRSGNEQTAKRSGHRAAYSQEPFYWELQATTPRHGERPFEICHIDHTQVDIELRCSRTGNSLGRPWVTFLVDAYSRRILAVYITFDSPSYRSCMMVLRICVMRHSRLPQNIVVDNGAEFHGTYFQTLNALFECTLKYRPPSKARFGAVGERLFGTAMTQLVYNLAGNTQITKKVRLMTQSVNPKNLSLWTLDLFYYYLLEWAYEIYDTTEHPALGTSPRSTYNFGIAQFGKRESRMIPYDSNFKLLTLPTTNKGKALVDSSLGVQINYIHYWNSAFRDPELQKTYVQVRYDPFDAGIAYAYVRGQWVECISEYYSIFKGRSEKEINLATTELKKQHSTHAQRFKVKAKQLAIFLKSAEAEEVMLTQRLRDAQSQSCFQVIEGENPNHSPYGQNQNLEQPIEVFGSACDNFDIDRHKLESYSEY
jgi:putative transposase